MLTPCLKCLTRPKPLRTPEPLAPSWIAATAAANSLMARRSWCPAELPEHNREQRVRRCENAFVAVRLLNLSLAISSMTFGSCAASSKASKAINSI